MYVKGYQSVMQSPRLSKEDVQPFKENSRIKDMQIKDVDLSFQSKKFMTSESTNQKLKIERVTKPGDVDIQDYFSFIKDIESIDEKDKVAIYSAIQRSTNYQVSATMGGDVFSVAQTTFELNILNERLIPANYQGKMDQAIQKMEADRYDALNKEHKTLLEKFDRIMSNLSPRLSGADRYTKEIDQLEAGTHERQTSAKQYKVWFADIQKSGQTAHDFERVLQQFDQLQLGNSNDPYMQRAVDEIKGKLREKWTGFMNKLQLGESYKSSSAEIPIINLKR